MKKSEIKTWYRIAKNLGQPEYGWGTGKEAEKYVDYLNARIEDGTSIYHATSVTDEELIKSLDDGRGGETFDLTDSLAAIEIDSKQEEK